MDLYFTPILMNHSPFSSLTSLSSLLPVQDLNISVPSVRRTTVDWKIYYSIQLTVGWKQKRFSLSSYTFPTTSHFYSRNINHFLKCPPSSFSCNMPKESKNKTVLHIKTHTYWKVLFKAFIVSVVTAWKLQYTITNAKIRFQGTINTLHASPSKWI